jgi:predicted Zn-dependent protease
MTSPAVVRPPAGILAPQEIIDVALAASGADDCVVVVESTSEANVRWANNTVTTNGVSRTLSWYVVCIVDGAAGTVSASAAAADSASAVAEVVQAAHQVARAAARSGRARDAQPLVGPENVGTVGAASPGGGFDGGGFDGGGFLGGGFDGGGFPGGGFEAAPVSTSFEVYADLLPSLGAAFEEARAGGRVLYGFARHETTTIHLGSSTGVRLRWVQPTGTLELNAKSADLRRSSWGGLSTPDFRGVTVDDLVASLTRRLEWARRTAELPAGRYDTVLPPTAVADFMINLAWSAAARPAHEGRSAFSAPGGGTRVGERLTGQALTLAGDPSSAGLQCAPFVAAGHSSDEVSVFDNGAPIPRVEIVADGVINSLLHSRGSAAEYGEPFTPAADNLLLTGGDPALSTEDLVTGVRRGLLLTSQWYLREVDPMTMLLTGLTRDGVFLIENGEITAAVNNFRFNMSPLDVLRHAVTVGATVPALSREWSDWFTRSAMPPMVVEGFNMSSVSPAQ